MRSDLRLVLFLAAAAFGATLSACQSRGMERLVQGSDESSVQDSALSSEKHRSEPAVESFLIHGRVSEINAGYKTVRVGDPVEASFDIRFDAPAAAVLPEHTVYDGALVSLKGHLGRFKFSDDRAFLAVNTNGWIVDTEPGILDGTTLTYDLIMNRPGVYPDASLQNLRNLDRTRFDIRTLFFETQPSSGSGILVTITRVEKRGSASCRSRRDRWDW